MSAAFAQTRRVIRFGSAEIAFTVTARPRRDLSITVRPDLDVLVVAPEGKSFPEIEARVRDRAAWILRQQFRFRELHPLPTPRRFVTGETHRYLGRQYRLRVIASSRNHVALSRPFLLVETKGPQTPASVQRLLSAWYRERAEFVVRRQCERLLAAHPSLRTRETRLRIRRMARRWGSCAPNGIVTINPELVRMSPACIEYVLAHELCHPTVMNHGPRFERLLSRIIPDWKSRRERLNRDGS